MFLRCKKKALEVVWRAMKIRMSEISKEGKEFIFDRKSGELNEVLADLTKNDYRIEITIRELDAYYEITGEVKADVPQVCSKCGYDILKPIRRKVNDLLIEKLFQPRGSQYSKSGNVSESVSTSEDKAQDVAFYENDTFELGEYLHELFSLEIPRYPDCAVSECSNLKEAQAQIEKINRHSEGFNEKSGHPAFKSLKNLKLN